MQGNITLEDIARDPALITKPTKCASGEDVVLRPLAPDDAGMLGEYFLGLLQATRRLYAPHPFDQATADKLCAEIDNAETLRLIATTSGGGVERVVAYFIVFWTIREGEIDRYKKVDVALDPETGSTLAPSVADQYQSQGLGSLMMQHIIDVARRLGRKTMVLSGGAREENKRAIHFYEKHGFRKVGEFRGDEVNNYDMVLELG